MPLFIDCYNLLHTAMPQNLAGLEENRLCVLLAGSGFARGRIVVVCDGQPKPHATASPVAEVELIYSGPGRTADDVIIELINADTTPRRVIVVSNDREIQKAARRRRARVMTNEQFIGTLARIAAAPGNRPTTRGGDPTPGPLSDHEVDAWMKMFGVEADEVIDPDEDWWDSS